MPKALGANPKAKGSKAGPAKRVMKWSNVNQDSEGEEEEMEFEDDMGSSEEYGSGSEEEGESGEEDDSGSEEEEEEDPEAQMREKLRQELADTPFEELQAMRERLGTKQFDAMMRSLAEPEQEGKKGGRGKEKEEIPHRLSKHRPREVTSKKPVARLRQVVPVTTAKPRDPRFDSLSGHFNQDLFQKSYSFLDDVRKKELDEVRKEIQTTKDPERRTELQTLLSKMQQEAQRKASAAEKQTLKRRLRKAESEAVAQGKKPFYLKKSEEKKLELVTKFNKIKESGKLQDYLKKKRRRNASKDHRYVPYERR